MKKTLIALAMAASAASSMAHAWTSGDFNGSVDIGGNITTDDYRQKWEWAVGNDLNSFINTLGDLTNDGKTLTVTVNGDKTILKGRTKEAFNTPVLGVGAVPHIQYSDGLGNVLPVSRDAAGGNNGRMHFATPLPVLDDAGNKIGQSDLFFSMGSLRAVEGTLADGDSAELGLASAWGGNKGSTNFIFNGGMDVGILQNGNDAALTAKLGGMSASDALVQLQQKLPNLGGFTAILTQGKTENMRYSGNTFVSASYASGFVDGSQIVLNFDSAITKTTQWHMPLNVQVSYN
ncbi:fimbrial protein [Salmonella enterica]|nr:fimbrial protein [Salmonella enterica]